MTDQMVSINHVVDLVKELTKGGVGGIVSQSGLSQDCNSRCGCVGQDCGCYNQVSGKFDRLSWVEFAAKREARMKELQSELSTLEQENTQFQGGK